MTLQTYKEKIRTYRGHLKSMDKELESIYDFGTEEFIEFSLTSKAIGVTKMAYIAENLSWDDQKEFIIWIHDGKRNKSAIDIKLLDLI